MRGLHVGDHTIRRTSTLRRNHHLHRIQALACAMGIAIAAIGFYRVRELVAALIIFSVLFGILGIALLTLFLIQELALKGRIRVGARLAGVRARHSDASGRRGGHEHRAA
jgi:hypothetical protein